MAQSVKEEKISFPSQCKSDPFGLNRTIVYGKETFADHPHIGAQPAFADNSTILQSNVIPAENLSPNEPLASQERSNQRLNDVFIDMDETADPVPSPWWMNYMKKGLKIMLPFLVYKIFSYMVTKIL